MMGPVQKKCTPPHLAKARTEEKSTVKGCVPQILDNNRSLNESGKRNFPAGEKVIFLYACGRNDKDFPLSMKVVAELGLL